MYSIWCTVRDVENPITGAHSEQPAESGKPIEPARPMEPAIQHALIIYKVFYVHGSVKKPARFIMNLLQGRLRI
jgi:hypothetical protein